MKISTKGRYRTMVMLDLALHYGERPILAKDIARRQHISERYGEVISLICNTSLLAKREKSQ